MLQPGGDTRINIFVAVELLRSASLKIPAYQGLEIHGIHIEHLQTGIVATEVSDDMANY